MAFHDIGRMLQSLPIGDGLCLSFQASQQRALRLPDDSPRLRPVLHRPVNGVTVSLDGRDPIDYDQDSVTIGVSPRRRSHVPSQVDVLA